MSEARTSLLAMVLPVAICAVGYFAPADIDGSDQAKQALYILDARDHGNWILPLEQGRTPASKPPLYTWLGVAVAAVVGELTFDVCRAPAALSALLLAWFTWRIGRERWGPRAGGFAVAAVVLNHLFLSLCTLARTDMLLSACMTASVFGVHRAESTGGADRGGAWWFWGGISAGILAKGPVALLLALVPLLVLAFWREHRPWIRSLMSIRALWTLLPPAIWFVLALLVGKEFFLRVLVGRELVERVLGQGSHVESARPFWYLVPHLFGGFAPWSLVALPALISACRRRARIVSGGPFPFAVSFLVGLLIFSVSAGKRPDYLMPLLPAAALATGDWLARSRRGSLVTGLVFAGSMLALLPVYAIRFSPAAKSGRGEKLVEFCDGVRDRVPAGDRVLFCGLYDNGVRFRLGLNDSNADVEELGIWLQGPNACWIVTTATAAGRVAELWPGRFDARLCVELGDDPWDRYVLLGPPPR